MLDVIVPLIQRVTFEKYQIADKENKWELGGVNHPACYKQNEPTEVGVRFAHGSVLSYATPVEVEGDVDSSDEYITGGDYGPVSVTFEAGSWEDEHSVSSQEKADAKVKDDYDVDIQWRYRVKAPAGTGEWISTGDSSNLRYYLVWDDSQRPAAEFKDSRIAYLVGLAEGEDSPSGIADELGPDLTAASRFDIGHGMSLPPPWHVGVWEVLDDSKKADCYTLATLMRYSLELLGVSGGSVERVYPQHYDWAGITTGSEYSEVLGEYYQLGFVAPDDWNQFEACCVFDGKWWMGGAGASKSSPYEVLFHWTLPNAGTSGNRQVWRDRYLIQQAGGGPAPAVTYPAGSP